MREKELIVYRDFEDGELLYDMAFLMSHYDDEYYNTEDMAALFYECIHDLIDLAGNYGFHGNLWHCYLANLLVNNENSYSCGCEIRGEIVGSINDAALHDIRIFKEFYDFDFAPMMEQLHVPEFSIIENYASSMQESKVYNKRICARICELAEKFCADGTAEEMKATLTQFYKEYGVGKFGLHKSFRITHDEQGVHIVPILNIAHVKLDDLVGYELPKKKLVDNTEAFVNGKKANNCLLFGDAGTGKSSSIEGGLEKKPENVLIYATSNRRHLIRENYSDKEETREDMHTSDTVQEKLSLVYRFGVTIYFGAPNKKEFQNIVKTLAERYHVEMPEEELLLEANKWELSHGGLSGRSAQQFIDYLLGK